ncbi:DNA topoisomerase (ATP-hydrolyzing) subunit A [Spiroplasma culicicola]|uniref:DNA topoisomerase (ATP-hydrolyzing) n=1 Tax=Spiroplasma culicicola AES-1 TaxID=1276246 RepID=W6A681_9MOLU|nr:DNA topoisomerase (ATP-hydrolyzing) subunit A [Spiroplasma culicicola]AHI52345.1 DNA gyrase subunit A [Spiroplasma culicicola AES-1]
MSDNLGLGKILEIDIKNEVEKDFLEYSMSVIVSRALPDLRDGLKPVHRRIIYAMNDLKITSDTPHKKSARIVGEVIGKYHPHGDSSVYEAMVRMSQDFSYRYPLVEGHGNFGSIDGDGAAAMRYTEARLSKISNMLLKDIDMDTVPYVDNYDASEQEPRYLTGYFPNLLVNGATGIAVGMATNIPPHNLREVISAIIAYIDNNEITIDQILEYIKGPDFPTGALMTNGRSMIEGYRTGKGNLTIRAKIDIEDVNKKQRIVISEIPYQTNKIRIVEKIAELYKNKIITGISDIRDESNYEGIRIVLDLTTNANAQLIIKRLYKYTSLQTNFAINMLSLNNGIPVVLNIKEIIRLYVKHQIEMILKRSLFEKNKLNAKLHILNAIRKTLDHIDEVIKIIRESKTTEIAHQKLNETFGFDEKQSKAILDMRLQRLVGLEREKIEQDISNIEIRIAELEKIINSREEQNIVLKDQLTSIFEKFGDDRRTKIIQEEQTQIDEEELIQDTQMILTLTENGYIRRLTPEEFKTQKRGGKGIIINSYPEDNIVISKMGKTKDDILFFSNEGKVYKIKGYNITQFTRTSRGLPIINFIGINSSEEITSVLPIKNKNKKFKYLVFITMNGVVKKVEINEFDRINNYGKIAIHLDKGDKLVSVVPSSGDNHILIASNKGKIIKVHENEFRAMSRSSRGVKGMTLDKDDKVMTAVSDYGNDSIATISEYGIMKKTLISEYNTFGRGAKGVVGMKLNDKTGKFKSMLAIRDSDEILMISSQGKVIKIQVKDINLQSRNSTGVIGFNLEQDEYITATALEFNKGE